YLKVNEPSIRGALSAGDLAAARRIVNGGLNGLGGFRAAFMGGGFFMRHLQGGGAFSKKTQGSRESRKRKEEKKVSICECGDPMARINDDEADERVQAPKRDDDAYGKARPRRKDDGADGKARVKKKDGKTEGEKPGKDGKKNGKGFFLFR